MFQTLLTYCSWPVGHVLLRLAGWRVFRDRPRRHWWLLPWYQDGLIAKPYGAFAPPLQTLLVAGLLLLGLGLSIWELAAVPTAGLLVLLGFATACGLFAGLLVALFKINNPKE